MFPSSMYSLAVTKLGISTVYSFHTCYKLQALWTFHCCVFPFFEKGHCIHHGFLFKAMANGVNWGGLKDTELEENVPGEAVLVHLRAGLPHEIVNTETMLDVSLYLFSLFFTPSRVPWQESNLRDSLVDIIIGTGMNRLQKCISRWFYVVQEIWHITFFPSEWILILCFFKRWRYFCVSQAQRLQHFLYKVPGLNGPGWPISGSVWPGICFKMYQ